MPIVIDGWNMIRDESSRISEDGGRSENAAVELIGYLEAFQETHADPITLVFDSASEYLETGHSNSRKLAVVAVSDADDYIKRFVERVPERQRRNLRVVSSDNEVYYFAKSMYAVPVRSCDFWKKLCP